MFCGIVSSNFLFLSSSLVLGPCCLVSLRCKSWGKRELLCSCCCSGKTYSLCCYSSLSEDFGCQNGVLPPLFIGFDLNTLPVKIVDGGLYFIFSFSFLFYFSFLFLLIFYF